MSTFFPPKPNTNPQIYAYQDPRYPGALKIGYTGIDVAKRVAQQYPVKTPGESNFDIVYHGSAVCNDGNCFTDKAVHKYLESKGITCANGEWYNCTVADIEAAMLALIKGITNAENRTQNFALRPEQQDAVNLTANYFKTNPAGSNGSTPSFLWNAKMRFGKTFTAYKLAQKMGWRKILVLTFKPAVESAWSEDLNTHIDFEGWQYVSNTTALKLDAIDKTKPVVCFGSFQDYLGKTTEGGIKPKNEWVHTTNWDCVILDEYHYGAWNENSKELFEAEKDESAYKGEGLALFKDNKFDVGIMPITTHHYLYLSGTPFRAMRSGEFIEDQIFNWTYTDEQSAKADWQKNKPLLPNPYAALPRLVMCTYQMPEEIKAIAQNGQFDGFDLNTFFKAEMVDNVATFLYEDHVQKWLDLIRGNYSANTVTTLQQGTSRPAMPFSDARLLSLLSHTFWYLPTVAACHAMAGLLAKRQNLYYHKYKVVVAAGSKAGIGVLALMPVQAAMADPLNSLSITLSCGKLTTGVSIKPLSGILMLRNLTSPESYFQAAFRVQTPWVVKEKREDGIYEDVILKEECYIFDFAPDRALRLVADYSIQLSTDASPPEDKVKSFINFLPILAYDGSSMRQIDAAGVLDMATSGTTATLLARRWESALLVNVDNGTLQRLLANKDALEAIMKIEGFRSLNTEIEQIINKSGVVQGLKKESTNRALTTAEKTQLTKEEKEYKSLRKEIQDKLIKFATRIPLFLYLTDFREYSLKDVITQIEPQLFRKVTGLDVSDFDLLVSLNIFNSALMNDAVYKFKRYEDASLAYTGLSKQSTDTDRGLFDTTIPFDAVFEEQPAFGR